MNDDKPQPVLEDSAELALRERITILETRHNQAVDAIKFAQFVAVAALLLAVGILVTRAKATAQ